jgi:hypothetical protein
LAALLLAAYLARFTSGVITVLKVRLQALESSLSERLIADAVLFRTPLVERFAALFPERFCGMARSSFNENRLMPAEAEPDVFMTDPP